MNQENFNINQDRKVKTINEGKLDYYFILSPRPIKLTFGVTDVRQDFDSSIFQILDNSTGF